mgnify:CR=1 FL=1
MTISPEAIVSIIADEAGLDAAKLRPEATLEELNIGSLDMASALFTLEDQFGIEIDPSSIAPSSTIGDLIRRVTDLATK